MTNTNTHRSTRTRSYGHELIRATFASKKRAKQS